MSILTERKSLRVAMWSWVFFIAIVFAGFTTFLSDEELAAQRSAQEEKKPPPELATARELREHGIRLHAREEYEAAIITYDTMIKSLRDVGEIEVQVLVAEAAYNRGLAYSKLGRTDTMLAEMDKLSNQFSQSQEIRLRIFAAEARLFIGDTLMDNGKFEQGEAIYANVIDLYGSDDDDALQNVVAWAYLGKAAILDERLQFKQAKVAYSDLVVRYEKSNRDGVREVVATALNNRGYITLRSGKKLWAEIGDGIKPRSLWGEALSDALAAKQITPQDPYVLATLGYVQFLLYSENDAKENLRKSLKFGGEDIFHALLNDATYNTISRDMDYVTLVKALWFEVQVELAESEV